MFARVADLERASDVGRFIDDRRAPIAVQIDGVFERDLHRGRPARVQVIADGRNSNTDLLIIDDFLAIGIHESAASDLFAILANREHRRPTIVASQSGPDYWARTLPDRVAADSIVNRLANNSRKINLGTIDMREQGHQTSREQPDYWE